MQRSASPTAGDHDMQHLHVVGRLFPLVLSGEKTSTIRWREAQIVPGPMRYVCDDDPDSTVVVMVTKCSIMRLADAAAYLGRTADLPDDVMAEGMREHYPTIELDDMVDVIEHLTPQETEERTSVSHYAEHGWVVVDTLGDHELRVMQRWVDDIAEWPDADGEWLHYRELTDAGPKLCRTENFVPFHTGLRELLTGSMQRVASALLGEQAVLYKEKINYKLVGGAGYSPHQDAPAYPFIATHVSCMMAIDDADATNGCLEVVSGAHQELLPTDDVGCIRADVVASLPWTLAPIRAGQTLWFHSRTPHRSAANLSTRDRRALYPTYNALAEGDLRDTYYREKLELMSLRTVGDGVQVSLIGDFQGRPVD